MNIEKALKAHRDAEEAVIKTSINATLALDKEWCDLLSEDMVTLAGMWEVMDATPLLHTQIPNSSGIYMFVWTPMVRFQVDSKHWEDFKHVLYVGKSDASSSSLRKRYKNEYSKYIGKYAETVWINDESGFNRECYLQKYLSLSPLQYWFCLFKDEYVDRISMYEQRLINLFKPPVNQQHQSTRFQAKFKEPVLAF